MSTGTPSPYAPRSRSAAPSRTARPVIGTIGGSRPVRIDLNPSAPFGAPPSAAWGVEEEAGPLAGMVDRAAAQVGALRRAVDEAVLADRAVRAHNAELSQRLAQGQQFAAELDHRIARAGQAAGIVEKAANALGALEVAVQQVRAAQDAVTRTFESRLAEQERSLRERLAQQETVFEQRMARQQEVFERRIGELAAQFEENLSHATADAVRHREDAEHLLADHRREVITQVEQLCAEADRRVAQAQARSSIITDGISDRIDVLNQQCQRIGTDAQERLDTLCKRAAEILGHDPRSDFSSEPRLGSLADAAARADALVLGVDEAAVRVAAMRSGTEAVVGELNAALDEARRITEERLPGIDALREAIERAGEQGVGMQRVLDSAILAQQEAAERAAGASQTLSRQREDLSAMAEAGRYHVEQCRAAESSLRRSLDEATERNRELDRAAAAVREQAESMVGLARDAATLVAKSRQQLQDGPGAHA